MDVVKTSRDISKTLKNANRLREVLRIFARNGFDEIIQRTKIPEKLSGFVLPKSKVKRDDSMDFWSSIGLRLKLSFEELGPGFIKIGQIISTREDIFDSGFVEQLKLLQSDALGIDHCVACDIFKRSTGRSVDEIFSDFSKSPLASASIGSVYSATLKSGEEVVVKFRKPGIKEILEVDFELFKFIIERLEGISEEFKFIGLSRVLDDFYKTIQLELNFNLEKNNLERLKKNIAQIDNDKVIYIPKAYEEFSSERVLVLEKLNGTSFSNISADEVTNELKENLLISTKLFLHTMLSDGFFHADLHGGNFFLLENNKIGLIDFGSMGHLSSKNKASLVSILYALTKNNYDHLVYEFLEIADYEMIPSHQELSRDLQQTLSPFIGLSSQNIDTTLLTRKLVQTLMKHQMFLPREWYIIFRAIITLDGVGRSIGVDINAFEILEKDASELIKKLFSKDQLMEESFWFGRDILNTMRIVPRHLSWFFKEASKKNYALEIKNDDLTKSVNSLAKAMRTFALTIMTCFLFYIGIRLIDFEINSLDQISRLSMLFFICGFSFIFYTFFYSRD